MQQDDKLNKIQLRIVQTFSKQNSIEFSMYEDNYRDKVMLVQIKNINIY